MGRLVIPTFSRRLTASYSTQEGTAICMLQPVFKCSDYFIEGDVGERLTGIEKRERDARMQNISVSNGDATF